MLNKSGLEICKKPVSPDILIEAYLNNGRIPWSSGYTEYKHDYIEKILSSKDFMEIFTNGINLPGEYGYGLDERCIEYPWFFSNLSETKGRILDAGSALNHEYILKQPSFFNKELTIMTLSPEANCFWRNSISYQYGDLRKIPFRDNWFDDVVCISTLEHVGMDNRIFTASEKPEPMDINAFEEAVNELKRVLIPGGKLYLTVPFGKYQNWNMFQQFDQTMLEKVSAVFKPRNEKISIYRYSDGGWQISGMDQCKDLEYSEYAVSIWQKVTGDNKPDQDNTAAARAVACLIWEK